MVKTTVYLPEELKEALARTAGEEHRSEADLIREAIRSRVERQARPRPRVPLVRQPLVDPTASERVDELLAGFGAS
jgi:Arc/MetJ-type ribon-helix-helix transcriptional regulator